eukprot:c8452_g1_i1.p1 GENE.c8452_g1_i1~~c8452_g1_i1.p1  ORF type:complete len:1079 (-),score=318.70 c8452_g1_i1:54-3248(-)
MEEPKAQVSLTSLVVLLKHQKLLEMQLLARRQWLEDQTQNHDLPDELRVRMRIEQKQLQLAKLQAQSRHEVLHDSLQILGDLHPDRRAKKLSRNELRPGMELERILQMDKDQRERDQRKKFMEMMQRAHAQFRDTQQNRKKELARLNRAILQFHREREKKRRQEEDKQRRDRLKALRENKEEEYLELIQNTKNERLTQLLQQTEEYLGQIGARVQSERERAFQFKSTEERELELLNERQRAEAATTSQQPPPPPPPTTQFQRQKGYYALAHRIQERVNKQPNMLEGGKLKDYQLEGLQWMVSLYNNGLNGILADEMGLGKTIQTIGLLSYLIEVKRNKGPFLIIVPLSTLANWQIEFEKWAPSIVAVQYRGNKDHLKRIEKTCFADPNSYNCVLTTYEMILKATFLRKRMWQYVIVDEGHRLKNADCKLFRMLATFTCRHRLLLTGTPLQNSLDELWALLNFLLPMIFSSCDNFEEWFNAPFQEKGGTQSDRLDMDEEETLLVINRLHQVLRPFVLRREKKEVESQLPEKKEHVIRCAISGWQTVLYDQIQKKALRTVDPTSNRLRVSTLNNTLVQLRKVCNHPFLISNEYQYSNDELIRSSGKFDLLNKILPKLLRTNHKVLIFSQMTRLLDLLEEYLSFKDVKYCRLDGSTKPEERGEVVKNFSNPASDIHVFLLSTRAGGLGLNLQVADTVILYDSDWNPQQDLQAQDRAHRIGQQSEVRVFRFVTATPMEQSMYERAMRKLDMDAKIIQAGKFNNRYTDIDRQEFLTQLLREQADASETTDVPDSHMLNTLISRSKAEFELFQQMDLDAQAERERLWRSSGQAGPLPPHLMGEDEIPAWMTQIDIPADKDSDAEPDTSGRRKRTKVMYDDGLSDKQFDKLLNSDVLDGNMDEGLTAQSIRKLHLERKRRKRQRFAGDESDDGEGDDNDGDDIDVVPKKTKLTHPPSKPWMAGAIKLFNAVLDAQDQDGRRVSDLFVELPSRSELPDYYRVIKQPVDLRSVELSLANNVYATPHQFIQDIRRISQNAKTYNIDSSQLFIDAVFIENLVEDLIPELLPELID